MLFPMASEEQLKDKNFPLAPDMFRFHQEKDKELKHMIDAAKKRKSGRFTVRKVEDIDLIHNKGLSLSPKRFEKGCLIGTTRC